MTAGIESVTHVRRYWNVKSEIWAFTCSRILSIDSVPVKIQTVFFGQKLPKTIIVQPNALSLDSVVYPITGNYLN